MTQLYNCSILSWNQFDGITKIPPIINKIWATASNVTSVTLFKEQKFREQLINNVTHYATISHLAANHKYCHCVSLFQVWDTVA